MDASEFCYALEARVQMASQWDLGLGPGLLGLEWGC